MSIFSRPRRRSRPDFSIAVINIVFLLLLFYLATGSLMKPAEMTADTPVTHDLPLELLPRPLLLVSADRSLFLDGVPVGFAELAEAVRAATAEAGVLNVLADRAMPAREFLDVLARLDAGGVAMRIVTLHAKGLVPDGGP